MTVSGEFSPGYDGVRTSARCLFKQRGVSTLTSIEPTSVQCASLAIPPEGNRTHYDFEMGVALNGAYIDDDSSDYVSIRAMCPRGAVSNYQRFVQYTQRVDAIDPTGGPTEGGTVVTVRGAGFLPINTPHLAPALLAPSARCLWQCTPRADNPQQCQEGGEMSEAYMTKPTLVTPTEIVCASPARLDPAAISFGLALNVYEVTLAQTLAQALALPLPLPLPLAPTLIPTLTPPPPTPTLTLTLQGVPAACDDGLHNGDEAGVDCGGGACRACAPTCFDGLQNGGETGVDCGGTCAFCIPSCSVPNSPDQTCQLPVLSHVSPASGPTGHATLLTVHGSGFYAAGALITYTKQVLGLDTPFTHTALPRCVFGSGANRQETTAD